MGIGPPSFASESLDALKNNDDAFYQEQHVKSAAGTMFVGGADITASTLGTFVLGMLANPEAQRQAQAEIDGVTGGKCLPTFEDQESLPYVSALVKEALRWKNVAPFGAWISPSCSSSQRRQRCLASWGTRVNMVDTDLP